MAQYTIISRHFLRRRARARATHCTIETERKNAGGVIPYHYSVRRAERGPYRWYCVRQANNAGLYATSYEPPKGGITHHRT